MRTGSQSCGVLLLLMFLACAGEDDGEAGSAARWVFSLEVQDTLDRDPSQFLAQPLEISVDKAGRYIVGDRGDRNIKVYDSLGDRVMVIGGSGGGPGEFRYLGSAGSYGDSIVGFDVASDRLDFFSPDGEFVRSLSLVDPGYAKPHRVRVLDDSLFLVTRFPLGTVAAPDKRLLTIVRPDGSTRSSFFERTEYFSPEYPELLQFSGVFADGWDGVVFAGLFGGDSVFAFSYDGQLLGGAALSANQVPLTTLRQVIERNGGSLRRPDGSWAHHNLLMLHRIVAIGHGRAVLQLADYDAIHGTDLLGDGGTLLVVSLGPAAGIQHIGELSTNAGLLGRDDVGAALLLRWIGAENNSTELLRLEVRSQ